ncbi:hypothetical protein [Actinoplanes sp. N902-109]|uniref:hypothetical protein n=1 Tax=Actinoplanes sp. (strain N902-109) TaxID=649831 RepID=UPI0005A194E2|nr:hypothetical protein [Actinoplanes sp. N902-109]
MYDSSCSSCQVTNAYADEWQAAERRHIARMQDAQRARQHGEDLGRFRPEAQDEPGPVRECPLHTGFTPGCGDCAGALVAHDRVKEDARRTRELGAVVRNPAAWIVPGTGGPAPLRRTGSAGRVAGAAVLVMLVVGLFVLVRTIGWLLRHPVLTVTVLLVAATAAMMFRTVRRRLGA